MCHQNIFGKVRDNDDFGPIIVSWIQRARSTAHFDIRTAAVARRERPSPCWHSSWWGSGCKKLVPNHDSTLEWSFVRRYTERNPFKPRKLNCGIWSPECDTTMRNSTILSFKDAVVRSVLKQFSANQNPNQGFICNDLYKAYIMRLILILPSRSATVFVSCSGHCWSFFCSTIHFPSFSACLWRNQSVFAIWIAPRPL